jgi:peptide/nickel transport system ATP-binding protein/oligopeptide transport system ATP-binding protein
VHCQQFGKEMEKDGALLRIVELRTYFHLDEGIARAVDGVSFEIPRGKTLGLVGESGCGKSVTALSIMRLVPSPPGRIQGGSVYFGETDLVKLSERQMRKVRGNDISMVFQEPMTSLNPVFTVGNQIMEVLRLHQKMPKKEARKKTIELLEQVGIPLPEQRIGEYPHQLSGGMKQRVMIAMALACNPELLIADEPTTALDVTIQAQLLDLMKGLQQRFRMSILLITHDLGVIAETADSVAVMYAGKIVEYTSAEKLFGSPKHPYTEGLFGSLPKIGKKKGKLSVIPGNVPNPLYFPPGCRFNPRCPYVMDVCRREEPPLRDVEPEHTAACHLYSR